MKKRVNGWRMVEAVAALLIHRGCSKCRAAELLGVTRRCLQKWFNNGGTWDYSDSFPRFLRTRTEDDALASAAALARVLPPHKVAAIYGVPCQVLLEAERNW